MDVLLTLRSFKNSAPVEREITVSSAPNLIPVRIFLIQGHDRYLISDP